MSQLPGSSANTDRLAHTQPILTTALLQQVARQPDLLQHTLPGADSLKEQIEQCVAAQLAELKKAEQQIPSLGTDPTTKLKEIGQTQQSCSSLIRHGSRDSYAHVQSKYQQPKKDYYMTPQRRSGKRRVGDANASRGLGPMSTVTSSNPTSKKTPVSGGTLSARLKAPQNTPKLNRR